MNYPGEVIKIGSTNIKAIREIKIKLNELGYGTLTPDNTNFGDTTEEAVRKFQKDHNLVTDGIIGELTWDRLFISRIVVTPSSKILRYRAMEYMQTMLYVREATNNNDGKEVEEFLKFVGLPKGNAWCMSFVYWAFFKASVDLALNNPVPKTGGVLECLRQVKEKKLATIIYNDPQEGDQGIMDFGGGKGHTFMIRKRVDGEVRTIEGNTNDGGSRDGDGVYERQRRIATIKCFIRYDLNI
jgi:hypothetical protein